MTASDQYPAGRKFRVVREGAWLSGWTPIGPGGFQGTRHTLNVGDVIETTGFGRGMGSDPGYGVHFKHGTEAFVEFYPTIGGAFAYQPAPGFLEPLKEGE